MKKNCLLIFLVLILSACGSTSPAVKPTDVPAQAVLASVQATAVPASVQATTAPAASSALDGAALLDERCSVCHSADKAKQVPRSMAKWDQTVSRMIGKGAQLNDAEKAALVDYLATKYGQ